MTATGRAGGAARVLGAGAAALALCAASFARAAPPQGGAPAWAEVLDDLNAYGDLRLRHESAFLEGAEDRHRERLRLRLGVDYEVSEELQFGLRAVTGDPEDANSNHVTFGDALDGFDLSLDRVFLSWRPRAIPGTVVAGGKFGHPLNLNPVYGELVWDADVQPEGAFASRRFTDVGPIEQLQVTLGAYSLVERGVGDDTHAWIAEVRARTGLTDAVDGSLSLAYYGYGDPTPDGDGTLVAIDQGNATADTDADGTPDEFVSDFGVYHAVASAAWTEVRGAPTVAAELVHNARAVGGEDSGWSLGVTWGREREKGDWRAFYQYQVIEQDSVFSPFAQDDFLRSTNHRSHVVGATYRLTDDVGLQVWALASEPEVGAGEMDWRVRIDLNVKL